MQGTQYATKRSILCRGAFCGPTVVPLLSQWDVVSKFIATAELVVFQFWLERIYMYIASRFWRP